ncbi:MAG: VOC family protein [Acidovorax sp.]|uniref:VOC family protein n=1 Tax=Acidovorax sp. TaxID=1872122 RepID=UPI00262CDAF0|nr:VOC family protein [Acidovorax sp.]MDH4418549.1 VOC family protein [Acidovorax sp.]
MLSHVFVGVNDFDRAMAFYSPVLERLGLVLRFTEPARPWAGWQTPGVARPLFLIGQPFDGQPAAPGNGAMNALLAADRATVDAVHALALQHGGRCEGLPGLRPEYHANYYGAYFRDPEGNKLCVCCHGDA